MFTQLLTGGPEPTRTAVALGHTWLTEPGQRAVFTARHEGFVDEVLRLACPFHFAPRTAIGDISVCGREIAAGSRVTLLLVGANRDPLAFPARTGSTPTGPCTDTCRSGVARTSAWVPGCRPNWSGPDSSR